MVAVLLDFSIYYTIPFFFRKIVEIERFALREAILDECQNYLGDRGRFRRKWENTFLAFLLLPL